MSRAGLTALCAALLGCAASAPSRPAPAEPASPAARHVSLEVTAPDAELERWFIEQLRRRNIDLDGAARTHLKLLAPTATDRGAKGCIVALTVVTYQGSAIPREAEG